MRKRDIFIACFLFFIMGISISLNILSAAGVYPAADKIGHHRGRGATIFYHGKLLSMPSDRYPEPTKRISYIT
jgi:hypothetical protein